MKPNCILLIITLVFVSHYSHAQNIDSEQASANFELKALPYKKIKGSFSKVSGTFLFNPQKLNETIIDIDIDTRSASTQKPQYHKKLREGKFFLFDEHPMIHFHCDSVVQSKPGYLVFGELYINGHAKNIAFDMNLSEKTIEGKTKISRFDFAVGTEAYPRRIPLSEDVVIEVSYRTE